VPEPPATKVIACPFELIVPANDPADPAAVEIVSEKFGTAPVETAEVGTVSACRND
jgi:hypothetical protein